MIFIAKDSLSSKNAIKFLISKLKPIVIRRVKKCTIVELKNYLTGIKIEEILSVLPEKMILENVALFQNSYNAAWDSEDNRINGISNLSEIDKISYHNFIKEINRIFNYKEFTKMDNKNVAYTFSNLLNINTCPYCNRIYTKTVIKSTKKTVTRPEFDHWYSQESYPLFALSFYNLIPSCHICNSNIKGSKTFNIHDTLHPYIIEKLEYQYSYQLNQIDEYQFKLKSAPNSKSEKFVKSFELKDIYETHIEEIKELVEIRKNYTSEYLKLLISTINPNLNLSIEEAYRLAFGVYYEPEKFNKRPLSKMKKDILTELGII